MEGQAGRREPGPGETLVTTEILEDTSDQLRTEVKMV